MTHSMASEMRAVSQTARSRLYRTEEKDFEAKLAAWKKRQDEKAKHAVAKLPKAINDAAKERMCQLIVRVETSLPYLYSETSDAYKEFRTRWADETILYNRTQVSRDNSRYLPRGCRPIARWALRHKFKVHVIEWKEEEFPWCSALLEVDCFNSEVIPTNTKDDYPIYTGLSIAW